MRYDNVVEGKIALAEARKADLDDHCELIFMECDRRGIPLLMERNLASNGRRFGVE